jgi:YjbE family integral membrane protein
MLDGDWSSDVCSSDLARSLPPQQQKKAIFWGSGAAIVMRIVLTIAAAQLLRLPFLKIIGSLLLMYIGVDLLNEGDEDGEVGHEGNTGMFAAIRTILVADLVMSLDNVLAVAAAAHGDNTLLIIGLAISIPLIIFGSTMLLKVMQRFPIIITLGAALLGFLAGEMLLSDPAVTSRIEVPHAVVTAVAIGCAVLVVVIGRALARRQQAAAA